jgi:hypothetical protein
MLKRIVLSLIAVVLMICNSTNADAFTINKGTISLGGSSSLLIGRYDTDETESHEDVIDMSIAIGYFISDNLEVGGLLGGTYRDRNDGDIKFFSISPFVTYHFELNEVSNIYLTGMIGYWKSDFDGKFGSDEYDGTILSAETGWEYFFNPSVSGTIGLIYSRTEDTDSSDTFTSTSFGTNIGLKIYF